MTEPTSKYRNPISRRRDPNYLSPYHTNLPEPADINDNTQQTALRHEQMAANGSAIKTSDEDSINRAARDEAAPTWKTHIGEAQPRNKRSGNSIMGLLAKKATKRWLVGFGVTAFIGLFTGGSGLLGLLPAHLHNIFNNKAFHYMEKSQHKRMGDYRKTKYFTNPDTCTASGVRCRFHQGLSDNEIKALERVGLGPEVGTSASGKKYILEFKPTDLKGASATVNAGNFSELYNTSPEFASKFNSIAKPMSVLAMGKESIDLLLKKFPNLNLTDPLGSKPASDEEAIREFRKYVYGEAHPNADTGLGDEINQQIRELANEKRAALEASNFDKAPATIPLEESIDAGRAPDIANAIGGSLKKRLALGFVGGALTIPDSACTAYGFSRALAVMGMLYKHKALIMFALGLQTIWSKTMAGDANPTEVSLVMNSLTQPSTAEKTKGKNFFDSEGWHLVSEGRIYDPSSLIRWATGGGLTGTLIAINQVANSLAKKVGINLNRDCLLIKSNLGQALLFVAGISFSFATLGAGAVAGVASSTLVSSGLAVAAMFAIPTIISYVAGTASPDLTGDPEGGFAVGQAAAAGYLAFGGEVGKANGMEPMKAEDYEDAVKQAAENERFMAKVDAVGKNPFALDNPDGLFGMLAANLAPYATSLPNALQGGMLAALNPMGMFSNAARPALMTNSVYAANEDPEGTQYCQDENIKAMGLAANAFCEIIYWQPDRVTNDPKYSPDATVAWMLDHGHLNSETGEPVSPEFRYFIADCIEDDTPMLEDGGGGGFDKHTNSAGGEINTTQCRSEGERENYFRAYIQYRAIDEAEAQGVNGSFGKEASI